MAYRVFVDPDRCEGHSCVKGSPQGSSRWVKTRSVTSRQQTADDWALVDEAVKRCLKEAIAMIDA